MTRQGATEEDKLMALRQATHARMMQAEDRQIIEGLRTGLFATSGRTGSAPCALRLSYSGPSLDVVAAFGETTYFDRTVPVLATLASPPPLRCCVAIRKLARTHVDRNLTAKHDGRRRPRLFALVPELGAIGFWKR